MTQLPLFADMERPPITSCACCGKRIPQERAVRTKTDDYCSETCANTDALDRFHREGE